jgi:hypothetical protein
MRMQGRLQTILLTSFLEPALQFVELRLHDENCDLEMTVTDDAGNVVAVLAYSLSFKPLDFDLDLLRAAWERWRGGSAAAS